MTRAVHPAEALHDGEPPFPIIAACDHYAGAERLIRKAMALQLELGPLFDVTADCEDGAATGHEQAHVEMVAALVASPDNRFDRVGARIHDPSHDHWRSDVDTLLSRCGDRLAHITIPKVVSAAQLAGVIDHIRAGCAARGVTRQIPLHVLIETHGALAEVGAIAKLPWMRSLDFGLMDFVSAHGGAIPASAMRSPGQFDHRLVARAKAEIAAAALCHGLVPTHNVCLDLKNPEQVRDDARRARDDYGFLRMWSIHPAQIMPIVEAMRPRHDEVGAAGAILLKAQAAEWGPIGHEGRLYDRASYRYYWNVLQRAAIGGQQIDEAVRAAFFDRQEP